MVRIPKPKFGPPLKYAFDTVTVKKPLVLTGLSDDEAEKVRRAANKYSCSRKALKGRFHVRKVKNSAGGFTVTVYRSRD